MVIKELRILIIENSCAVVGLDWMWKTWPCTSNFAFVLRTHASSGAEFYLLKEVYGYSKEVHHKVLHPASDSYNWHLTQLFMHFIHLITYIWIQISPYSTEVTNFILSLWDCPYNIITNFVIRSDNSVTSTPYCPFWSLKNSFEIDSSVCSCVFRH